jgi:hypothetical protein
MCQYYPGDVRAKPELVTKLCEMLWKLHKNPPTDGFIASGTVQTKVTILILKLMENAGSVRAVNAKTGKLESYDLALPCIDVCSELSYKHALPEVREGALSVLSAVSLEVKGKQKIQPSVVASVLQLPHNQTYVNKNTSTTYMHGMAVKLAQSCSEHPPFRVNLVRILTQKSLPGQKLLDEIFGPDLGLRYVWEAFLLHLPSENWDYL